MSADVLVVGGGAIGVSAAYELARMGFEVTLLERGDTLAAACSAGNAGLICPSHSAPLATPSALREGMRSLLRRDSPLSLRPRPATLPWLGRFAAACRADRADRGRLALQAISIASLDLHAELERLGTSFERRGILDVCETDAGFEEIVRRSSDLIAMNPQHLSPDRAHELEPALGPGVAGAIFHPEEAYVNPVRYVGAIGEAAAAAGAVLRTRVAVRSLRRRQGSLVAETSSGELRPGKLVLAAGAWTAQLARSLGVFVPLIGGKGHHIDLAPADADPSVPMLLHEARLSISPFAGRLRVAGRIELTRLDARVSPRQIEAIWASASRLLPQLERLRVLETWAGLRPCTPDGLPVIGCDVRAPDVVIATGHAMKGIALAPVTGRLVSELVAGEPPSHDLEPFRPGRFRPLFRPR